MKKLLFNNTHASGLDKPMQTIENVFLSASTIGSTVCIASIGVSFVNPETTIFTHPLLWAPAIIIGFVIAYLIDFHVIKKVGKFAVTEFIAWLSGHFVTPILRRINTVMMMSVFAFGVFLSIVTSFYGSEITAKMAPTIIAESPGEEITEQRKAVKQALKPYTQAVKDVENKIAKEKKVKINSELRRLEKRGNQWAKNEILAIEKAIDKSYSRELDAAKTDLAKATEREEKRADIAIASVTSLVETTNEDNQKRSGIIWKMLAVLGVLPLIFGVIILVIGCNNSVMIQIPKEVQQEQVERAQNNQGGAGPRSDNFQNLYSNP